MMRSMLLLFACVLLVGCATARILSNDVKLRVYLMSNSEVTEEIRQALCAKTPLRGMIKQEVRLCLGEPSKIEYVKYGTNEVEQWAFYDRDEIHGTILDADKPAILITFDRGKRGRVVTQIAMRQKGSNSASAPAKAPAVSAVARPSATPPQASVATNSGSKSSVRTAPSAKTVVSWPDLRLEGVIKRGDKYVALINKEMVGAGGTVSGVNVVSISADGVTLEFGGETHLLQRENEK